MAKDQRFEKVYSQGTMTIRSNGSGMPYKGCMSWVLPVPWMILVPVFHPWAF